MSGLPPFPPTSNVGTRGDISGQEETEKWRVIQDYQVTCGHLWTMGNGVLAEREGFEPPIRLPVCRISSAVHSTTLPPLHPTVIYHGISYEPAKSGAGLGILRVAATH